ncbi:hypothetical protein AN639_12170 [Candidatus Epulonipiscium fishelsonii]|nr:hypothetical protein AN639_12170 [Epulopiscium sp. SCG-B05WGA-EpuloA1]
MTIASFVNVIARYVFNASLLFIDELTTAGLVIVSFMGAAVAAKRRAHLGLTVLTDLLPKSVQKACLILSHICGMLFSAIMTYYGFLMTQNQYRLGQLSIGMQWPEWLYGMWIPICGVVIFIRFFGLFLTDIKSKGEN